jgi:hypothetical protein
MEPGFGGRTLTVKRGFQYAPPHSGNRAGVTRWILANPLGTRLHADPPPTNIPPFVSLIEFVAR